MNRNTVRLCVAVVAAWLVGALGGLAVVPYAAFVFVFCGVMVVALGVAMWDRGDPPDRYPWRRLPVDTARGLGLGLLSLVVPVRRPRPDPRWIARSLRRRYRLGWLAATLMCAIGAGWLNIFMFAQTVLAVDGERVHANRIDLHVTSRLRDPGEDVECVFAGVDGRRIPGALPLADGDTCHETEDLVADPHGLVDPVRAGDLGDTPGDALGAQALLLGVPLALCVPAAWPRMRRPVPTPGRRGDGATTSCRRRGRRWPTRRTRPG